MTPNIPLNGYFLSLAAVSSFRRFSLRGLSGSWMMRLDTACVLLFALYALQARPETFAFSFPVRSPPPTRPFSVGVLPVLCLPLQVISLFFLQRATIACASLSLAFPSARSLRRASSRFGESPSLCFLLMLGFVSELAFCFLYQNPPSLGIFFLVRVNGSP